MAMMPPRFGPAVLLQRRLLHQAACAWPSSGNDRAALKSRIGQAIGDLFAFGQVQQVDDRPAAAFAAQLRQVVDLLPVDLAVVGEEQQVVVRAGDEQVLDRIFFLGLRRL